MITPSGTSNQELLRPLEVARILGVTIETVKRNAKAGKIPGGVRVGNALRFDAETIGNFVSDCKPGAAVAGAARLGPRVRFATPQLAAEDSRTTKRIGICYEHRWVKADAISVSEEHPFDPRNVAAIR